VFQAWSTNNDNILDADIRMMPQCGGLGGVELIQEERKVDEAKGAGYSRRIVKILTKIFPTRVDEP
jgi:hypothetical protein